MTTPAARFSDSCAAFLNTQILPPLVEFLRTKNCTVTVQELAGALNMPAPAPALQGVQVPTIPGFTQTTAPVTAARGKGKARPAQPYNGPTCQYVFKRGKRVNESCGEPALPGKQFCKNCDKKKGGGGIGEEPAAGAAPAGPPAGFKGFTPAPVAAAPAAPSPQGKARLDAYPIPGQPGLYKEKNHGFIIQQTAEDTFVVRAIESGGKPRGANQLTDTEKQLAHQLGLVVEEAVAPAPPQPAAPPQLPGMPQLPQLPGMPPLPGMPQLPGMPPIRA